MDGCVGFTKTAPDLQNIPDIIFFSDVIYYFGLDLLKAIKMHTLLSIRLEHIAVQMKAGCMDEFGLETGYGCVDEFEWRKINEQ